MFEKIVLRGVPGSGNRIDAGLLAETLLFYGDVLVILNRGSLVSLLKELGPDIVFELAEQFNLKLSYMRELLGTLTNTINGIKVHRFSEFSIHGFDQKKFFTPQEEARFVITREFGASRQTKKLIKKLLDTLSFRNFRGSGDPELVSVLATRDLTDKDFVHGVAAIVLKQIFPEFVPVRDWRFGVIQIGEEFLVDTNLPVNGLNEIYRIRYGGEFTGAYIINHLLEARADAYLASSYMSEYVSSPISAEVMKNRFLDLIRKRERDVREIDLFQNMELKNAPTLREAINSGERNFKDFIAMLRQARRFKEWIRGRNPDEALAAEYTRAVRASSWADKLPSKTLRWLGTTGLAAGLETLAPSGVGLAAGLAVGGLDALLLERVARGWRPDQFVEGKLLPFVSGA